MICEAKGYKQFHLFDTFAGLPKPGVEDRGVHREHQYACNRASVEQYLVGFPNLFLYGGVFPDSTKGVARVEQARYSLVHFDVDLYESTRACLEFFYTRVLPAGILIAHDYFLLAGVRQAFD